MPCRSYEDDIPRAYAESSVRNAEAKLAELTASKEHWHKVANDVTALLCKTMGDLYGNIDASELEGMLSGDVVLWYKQHRKADIANLTSLIGSVALEDLSIEDFDKLDAIFNKY